MNGSTDRYDYYDGGQGDYIDYLDALACERASDYDYGYEYFNSEREELEEFLEGEDND